MRKLRMDLILYSVNETSRMTLVVGGNICVYPCPSVVHGFLRDQRAIA